MSSLSKKPALDIIRGPIMAPNHHLTANELEIDRHTLAKRRWRGTAADGREFGFDLDHPLRHGDVFFQTPTHRYVIAQIPESVLRVALTTPVHAARLAWQIGNLHFRVMLTEGFLLVEDDPALRQMFEREGIEFTLANAVFQPLAGAAGHHDHHQ